MSLTIWGIGMSCIVVLLLYVRSIENEETVTEDTDECIGCDCHK